MTQEQMERAMEFILNQQASTSVKLDMMVVQQAKDQKRLARLEQRTNTAIRLGARFMRGLGKAAKESRDTQKTHEENLAQIEANLNAVILLLERHITETHGTV